MNTTSESPSDSDPDLGSFFSTLLAPGSSLNPSFLLLLDAAFAALLLVLLALAFASHGNIHLIALTGIELALWASVKWFVTELQKVQAEEKEKAQRDEVVCLNDNPQQYTRTKDD